MILSAYLYEVQHNIFVGDINHKLLQEYLKSFKLVTDKESLVVIYNDKKRSEQFSIKYFNCPSNETDLDGTWFFKAL
jgi:CRISPR/Cas system-associated endoribonuclease Cas2